MFATAAVVMIVASIAFAVWEGDLVLHHHPATKEA